MAQAVEFEDPGTSSTLGRWRKPIQEMRKHIGSGKHKVSHDSEDDQDLFEEFLPPLSEDSATDEDDDRCCKYGVRDLCPGLYTWLMARAGTPSKVAMVLIFLAVDMTRLGLQDDVWSKQSDVNISAVMVTVNAISLVIALSISMVMEGGWALGKIFDFHAVWRCLIVAAMFQGGYHLIASALDAGANRINVEMFGYLYMPLSALLSYLFFRREYGHLEWIALLMMMLATMAVVFLRERCLQGNCLELRTNVSPFAGAGLLTLAVLLSCTASCLAERIFKDRSVGLFRAHEEHRHDHYYIHKVHLDFCGIWVAAAIWWCPETLSSMVWGPANNAQWFGGWTARTWLFVFVNVCQWWMAGLIAKRFSTVIKALIQTSGAVVLIYIEDAFLHKVDGIEVRQAPTMMLIVVVLMSALIFQTGRINLKQIRRILHQKSPSKMQPISVSNIAEGIWGLMRDEMHLEEDDGAAEKGSWAKMLKKYTIIILYILADATRTELYTITVGGSMITPQSFSVAINGAMLLLSTVLVMTGKPQEGSTNMADLKEAYQPAKLVKFMSCGFFFALTSALMSMAMGMGLSGAMSVVIGKVYLPVCALASRFLLGKFYLWLEWFAIIILTVDSAAFGSLKTMGADSSSSGMLPILLCAGSATSAAMSALVMEKLMKSEPGKPFMMQKLRCDFACCVWSVLFVWPMGWLASPEKFAKGAYWLFRPTTYDCSSWGGVHTDAMGICGSWTGATNFTADGSADNFVFGSWANGFFNVNAALAAGDCTCGAGIWVAWDDYRLYAMLIISVFYGFITGLVVTQFGSVKRAIADAFSLMLVYFVGDPLVKGTNLSDTSLNLTCFIMPLSSQTFSMAADELRKVDRAREEAEKISDAESMQAGGSTTEGSSYLSDG